MTIVHAKQQVLGLTLDGVQISCHKCHGTNFMKLAKHLPDQVIGNKFRERGWDVNSSGKDFCPDCIVRKKGIPKGTKLGPRLPQQPTRIIPTRDTERLNAHALEKVIYSSTLLQTSVIELDHRHRRFRITFKGIARIPVNRVNHAQSEIVLAFGANIIDSDFESILEHQADKNIVTLHHGMNWYLTLEERKLEAAE